MAASLRRSSLLTTAATCEPARAWNGRSGSTGENAKGNTTGGEKTEGEVKESMLGEVEEVTRW